MPGATAGTTNTDTATFNTTSTNTTPFVDPNRNLENITFDTSAAAYTFNNGPFVLTSGGTIQIASTFTGSNITETFNTPLTLEGNYTLANNATNAGDVLTFAGAISSGVAGTQTLTVSGNDAVNINGAIGGGTGTIALAKNGNDTLALGGSGDNTGLAVTVNSGIVILAKSSSASVHAIGSGGLTINGGAVQLSGTGGDQISDSATVTFINSGLFMLNGHNETIAGLVGLTSSSPVFQNEAPTPVVLTINSPNGANHGFSGTLSDGGVGGALSLVKSGNGEQDLGGNNAFTGGVTINAGTLGIANAGAELDDSERRRLWSGEHGNLGSQWKQHLDGRPQRRLGERVCYQRRTGCHADRDRVRQRHIRRNSPRRRGRSALTCQSGSGKLDPERK